jgi:hypothetical protein
LKRPAAKDTAVTFDDVELVNDLDVVDLRRHMEAGARKTLMAAQYADASGETCGCAMPCQEPGIPSPSPRRPSGVRSLALTAGIPWISIGFL